MARRKVTDPNVLQQLDAGLGAPISTPPAPTRRRVVDPAVRQQLEGAAETKRAEIGVPGGPPTLERSRITQAFDVAADPRANQPFPVPRGSEYGFQENMGSRLPFGDEAAAFGGGVGRYLAGKSGFAPEIPFSEAHNYGRAINRAAQEKYRAEHPWGDIGGQVLGVAAAGPSGAARALGVRGAPAATQIAPTVAGRTAEGIRSGAGLGALYGASEGEGLKDRARNMALGGATGAIVGAALPLAGGALRSARRMGSGYEPPIGGHVQRLEQEADQLYTQMDQQGVYLTPNARNRILHNLTARARVAGFRPRLHDNLNRPMNLLAEEAVNPTFPRSLRGMDELRRAVRDSLPPNATTDERRILGIMIEGLDENLNRLGVRDLAGAQLNPRQALQYLQEGRRLVRQRYKAETIDNLYQRARDALGANYTQAGLQTGIRQQFRPLNRKIREDRLERARWTNEERAIINRLVRGGRGENVMRNLGKLAVRSKWGAGTYVGGATGASYLGLPPEVAVALAAGGAAVGEVAKRASTARSMMNIERLDNLVGTGQAVPMAGPPVRQGLGQARRFMVPQLTVNGPGLGDRRGLGDMLLGQ